MAFKMNFSGFKNVGKTGEYHNSAAFQKSAFKHDNPDEPFHVHDTPKRKAQRDLDAMEAGSRRNPDGTRKKGKAKKDAKEMRKWTGLDQQKYDRDAKKQEKSFRGKSGQEGLDKYRDKQQRKRQRKADWKKSGTRKVLTALNPFDAESKKARAARSTARKNERREKESGKGVGKDCTEKGCGAYK
jgi:hypothetical protein